jgi:DNA polymerase-3 subunit alpha
VMSIANRLANFTMGQADILRKAMGKKRPEEMEKLKEAFIQGAKSNGISEKKANRLFDLMTYFAEYGFNKSHSAAYAHIAYQTAYLKAHYAVEFMAATLSADTDNTDKIVKSINECREMGILILPPDINESGQEFKVIGNSIRFGLEAVKGVGAAAIESVIESRNVEGPFTSTANFLQRVDSKKVNKKVLEGLIKAGAFDSLGTTRAGAVRLMAETLNTNSRSLALGQQNIFGAATDETTGSGQEWDELELLRYEKDALGFYITGHPLVRYEKQLSQIHVKKTSELENTSDGDEVQIGGILRNIKRIQTRGKAEIMAYCTIEDADGSTEVIVFPQLYRASLPILQKDTLLLIKGTVDKTEKGIKIVSTGISRLDELEMTVSSVGKAEIRFRHPQYDSESLKMLKSALSHCEGGYPLYLRISLKDTETVISTNMKISPDTEVISKVEEIVGKGAVKFI